MTKPSPSVQRLYRLCRQVETVEQRLLRATPKPKPADWDRYAVLHAKYVATYRALLDVVGHGPRVLK
jgi:hypothetical protein